jgi:glycosyltransferase involved in cell wall biosynthesis
MLLGKRPTGVDRVGLAYIRHYGSRALAVLSCKGFYVTLSKDASEFVFGLLLRGDGPARVPYLRLLAQAIRSASPRIPRPGILFHTAHSGAEFTRYFRSLSKQQVRVVFMVHDLIPLTHAEYCGEGIPQKHERRMRTALALSAGIVANSQATLDRLIEYASSRGLNLPPAVAAKLASGMAAQARMPPPLDTPYFVMVGTIEPRKNHWIILHVWRRLVELRGNAAPKLIVIGRRGWKYENVIDMLERCPGLSDTVIHEPDCPDDMLHAWLQHARALLFPSFAEGYGMPLVEALALGVPVLASDLPVFREFAGDIPEYLDPLDGPAWLSRIQAYAHPSSRARARQLARVQEFREPTWAAHFASVDCLVGKLCG